MTTPSDEANPSDDIRLTCPQHGEEIVHLQEDPEDDGMVVCSTRPECDYVFQNIRRRPVVELHQMGTDGTVLRNMLTGDYVDRETAARLNSPAEGPNGG